MLTFFISVIQDFSRRIHEQYRGLMMRLALQITKNNEDAEEAVQDALLILHRKQSLLETFSEDDERNYIYTVTRNEALRYARAQKKNPEYVTISASDPYIDIEGEPDIDAFRNEFGFSDNVAAALRELNESERGLICYYYGAGFSYRQLGRLMDVKPATLRKRMERCLKKLETVLREEQIR